MSESTPLRVVLLDIDGTLLDSNDAHARSWVEALKAHRFEVDYGSLRPLIGMGSDKVLPRVTGLASDDPLCDAMTTYRLALFLEKYLPTLGPTLGARTLVERILSEGLQPVVATSAGSELPALLRQAGLADLLHLSASADEAPKSKPDDDIIHAALTKAGACASAAVMVGDTPYDVQAARSAGVRAISLRCGGWWSDDAFQSPGNVYDDPLALVRDWNVAMRIR